MRLNKPNPAHSESSGPGQKRKLDNPRRVASDSQRPLSRRRSRHDAALAFGLFTFTLLSRLPFRSRILYHWDSVNFAFAMREFDIAKGQPHPPGYIAYVWLCRLSNILFGDAQNTMVAISIVSSALATVALFRLGRAMFNREVGLISAVFLATSPLVWFYGEIALPHALDMFWVILSAWLLYEVMQGRVVCLYPAVGTLAIAAGMRPQTLVFLAPLMLFAVRRIGWRQFLMAGALGAALCLTWFLPLIRSVGGLLPYMEITGAFSRHFQAPTSLLAGGGWWGLERNVAKLALYTLYGLSLAIVPALAYATKRIQDRKWAFSWQRFAFLVLWVGPAAIYYIAVHMGQQGLVFVFLPALLLMGAASLTRLLRKRPKQMLIGATVIVLANTTTFCLMPEYPLGESMPRLLTYATLVNNDRYFAERFRAIETDFDPASTAILTASWRHVEYYLPEYALLPFDVVPKREKGAGTPSGSFQEIVATPEELTLQLDESGHAAIVVFDSDLMRFSRSPNSTQVIALDKQESFEYFLLAEDQAFFYGPQRFGLAEE